MIGFNVQIPNKVAVAAEMAGVGITNEKVIYKIVDTVKELLEDAIPPVRHRGCDPFSD